MSDYFQNLPPVDPISLDAGPMPDPMGAPLPDASAQIGTGISAPAPGQAAPLGNPGDPTSGMPPMPMLPEPTTSQKLIAMGMAMIQADHAGLGLGGSLGAGMNAYNNVLLNTQDANQHRRMQQLAEFQLMGQIADRHNTELTMHRKLAAQQNLKQVYPELADLIDADPEGAMKVIAEKTQGPTYKDIGGKMYAVTPGQPPVPLDPATMKPFPPADPNAPDTSTLTGEDWINTAKIDPQRAAQLRSWALGKTTMNKRSKTYTQDQQDMLHYDPQANDQTLLNRNAVAKDFSSSGASGKILASTGTAASHLADLKEAYEELHNGSWQGANFIANKWAGTHAGPKHKALNKANLAISTIAPELDRIASGTDPTVSGTADRAKKFNLDDDPDAFMASLNEAGNLIKGKSDSLIEQYQRNMGQKVAPETIKPFSDRVLNHFKDLGVDLSTVNDALAPPTPSDAVPPVAALPALPVAPVGPPAPGEAMGPPMPGGLPAIVPQAGGGILDAPPMTMQQKLEYTAKKHGITVQQLKAKLGIK